MKSFGAHIQVALTAAAVGIVVDKFDQKDAGFTVNLVSYKYMSPLSC